MALDLKTHRVRNGLTQDEASKKIGVSVQTLISWEKGKTFPNVAQVKDIEKAYNTTYDDIIFLQ